MTDIDIIEAIRKATNGEFVGEYASCTLMGWQQNYDEQGRPLYANPNYKSSFITIKSKTYGLIRKGWYAWVIKPEYKDKIYYTHIMVIHPENLKDYLVTGDKIDLRPDYVIEYENSIKH